jgi:hypothetical protein
MLRDETKYLSSIAGGQECQKCVPDESSHSEREKKFSHGILHGACGKQKWKHGYRRREQVRSLNVPLPGYDGAFPALHVLELYSVEIMTANIWPYDRLVLARNKHLMTARAFEILTVNTLAN